MEELDLAVGNAIRVLAQTIQEICLRRNIDETCSTPLNNSQFLILNLLCAGRRFSVGEIARLLRVTPPAVCHAVDRLEHLDLAERRTRVDDRRTHDVVLLPPGRELMDRFAAVTRKRQQNTLACLDRQEKEQLLDMVRRLVLNALEGETNTEVICLQCVDRSGKSCVLPENDTRCVRRRRN